MKILLKILCAPMIAVLSVFVWLASKLVQISAVVMNFIAIAVGLGALCISNRAYVLENGRITMSGDASTLLHDDKVRKAYLGA